MNLISLIVGRLMNLRKFSGDLRFLSGAAGRWHWNSRDSGLTSKVYALFICRICRWLIGHGWTVWYNDEWHKKTCFVIHNFPTPPHHNMIISAVSHRQCQPRIEAFYDAIVSATHSKVYTLSISWNALFRGRIWIWQWCAMFFFASMAFAVRRTYCQLFLTFSSCQRWQWGSTRSKSVHFVAFIELAITHLLAALVVFEIGDGLAVDRSLAGSGHSNRDIAACSFS